MKPASELILWRHADAEPGLADARRALTDKGRKQATRVARWLAPRLEGEWVVLSSPAVRTRQTAEALGRPFEVLEALSTSTTADALLEATGWPAKGRRVIVVGHQPTLGEVAARLLTGGPGDLTVKKGALWWFSCRDHGPAGFGETVLRAVIAPDLAD